MWTVARLGTCVLGLALLLTACGAGGGARSTPDEAFASLQQALNAGDAPRVLQLLDGDSRAYYSQEVRTARARRAAGETSPPGRDDAQLTHDVYHTGTPEDAAAQLALHGRPLDALTDWLVDCTVLERSVVRDEDGRQWAQLRVRATDGTEREVLMIHEQDGWALDAYRHFQKSMSQR